MVREPDCILCRHFRRNPIGPGYWEVECLAQSKEFGHADLCAEYAPPTPCVCREGGGVGYVWDGEYEGAA